MFFAKEKKKKIEQCEGKTENIFPVLKDLGENVIYGPMVVIEKNNVVCEFSKKIKTYNTVFQRKTFQWEFVGYYLKIKDPSVNETLFCHNKKIFNYIVPKQFQKVDKTIKEPIIFGSKFKCYTVYGELSASQEALIERYIKWIYEYLDYFYFTAYYALYITENEVHIIFHGQGGDFCCMAEKQLEKALEML